MRGGRMGGWGGTSQLMFQLKSWEGKEKNNHIFFATPIPIPQMWHLHYIDPTCNTVQCGLSHLILLLTFSMIC